MNITISYLNLMKKLKGQLNQEKTFFHENLYIKFDLAFSEASTEGKKICFVKNFTDFFSLIVQLTTKQHWLKKQFGIKPLFELVIEPIHLISDWLEPVLPAHKRLC